jgi:L-2-hydroxyglutarate oxidase
MTIRKVDVVVVGGGIVGLSTAYALQAQFPDVSIAVIEKEREIARHQTGRNSGVVHSGIYYQPGSLKATTCRSGKRQLETFCQQHDVPIDRCGKIIVATESSQLDALSALEKRGRENGIDCSRIDEIQIKALEPHAAGIAGLHVPETGIVDYVAVCRRLRNLIEDRGNAVLVNSELHRVQPRKQAVELTTSNQGFSTSTLINCAGLQSDRVMRLCGMRPPVRIVPFRGEYFTLSKSAEHLCRNLIYPVPDASFPFLGVHFTRMIHGGIECGPNAVLAMAREGYGWRNVQVADMASTVSYGGFLRLATKYWKTGAGEIYRSLSKRAFVKALQRLIPEIRIDQLHHAPSGVRAQAVGPDGRLVDDFLIVDSIEMAKLGRNPDVENGPRMIHVCNAPSPAATAGLEIGRQIAQRL